MLMTQQTGSEGKSPWEMPWNLKPIQATVEAVAEKVVNAVKQPWEMMWKEKAPTPSPSQPTPLPEPPKALPEDFDNVFNQLINAESGGKHMDEKTGKLIRSRVGALGITQIMPETANNPGYGIAPLKDSSEGEYRRLGKEYLKAMLNEFNGDYEKALAAYNAGVGNVKKAVSKGGDEWKNFLPRKEETIPYINKILKKGK